MYYYIVAIIANMLFFSAYPAEVTQFRKKLDPELVNELKNINKITLALETKNDTDLGDDIITRQIFQNMLASFYFPVYQGSLLATRKKIEKIFDVDKKDILSENIMDEFINLTTTKITLKNTLSELKQLYAINSRNFRLQLHSEMILPQEVTDTINNLKLLQRKYATEKNNNIVSKNSSRVISILLSTYQYSLLIGDVSASQDKKDILFEQWKANKLELFSYTGGKNSYGIDKQEKKLKVERIQAEINTNEEKSGRLSVEIKNLHSNLRLVKKLLSQTNASIKKDAVELFENNN